METKTTIAATSTNSTGAEALFLEALERTVQEIQALNAIYNNETTSFEDDDDESNATKFIVVSREDFQAAQKLIKQSNDNSSSTLDNNSNISISGPISPLTVKINVVLTSADGVKFEANVDITLPSNYPGEAALITKASITDLDLGREINEFSKVMNDKANELSGSEALENMIQCVQDYAAEYVANYGHERVDDCWNDRPSYFTSYTLSNEAIYHDPGDDDDDEEENLGCWKISSTNANVTSIGSAAGRTKRKSNDVKGHPRSKSKSYKGEKPKRKKSQSKTFEQRLEDLKQFKEVLKYSLLLWTAGKRIESHHQDD
jgi:hypothetical protein